MNKYLQIFKISFQQEFIYRLNFVMWRLRNVLQILLTFFLWDTVFTNKDIVLFGYDKSKILTYVFGLIVVRAFVLSSRTVDVSGEISRGDLSNYLVKPVSYFKYWLTRDLSSKGLNLIFAAFETLALYFILKPPFFIQTNLVSFGGFLISVTLAMFIFFVILFITSSVPFWIPEAGWGVNFLFITIVVEFLSGVLFPLDILPEAVQKVLYLLPFPYLIFFPLEVYLGKITGFPMIRGILISSVWLVILFFVMKYIWGKGLKIYQAYGR